MEGYTSFNIQIPNERADLLKIANNLSNRVKNVMQNIKAKEKRQNEDIMSLEEFERFAGSATGAFGDMSVNEMRENKALRR